MAGRVWADTLAGLENCGEKDKQRARPMRVGVDGIFPAETSPPPAFLLRLLDHRVSRTRMAFACGQHALSLTILMLKITPPAFLDGDWGGVPSSHSTVVCTLVWQFMPSVLAF